jgi:hypothetical protein
MVLDWTLEVYIFELSIKFYVKSSPKTLKLVNISRGSGKGAKNSYGSYLTEFVFKIKYELKASFKKRANKIFHLYSHEIPPGQSDGIFFSQKSVFSDKS